MSIVKFRDKQIEQIGQDYGDLFVLYAKSYMACMDALKDVVELSGNKEVTNRVLQLKSELEQLELLYTSKMDLE